MQDMRMLFFKAVKNKNIALSLRYEDELEPFFVTQKANELFGVPYEVDWKRKYINYFLSKIVFPEDRKTQEELFYDLKNLPSREYRIIHPEKGIRYIKTFYPGTIKIDGKKVRFAVFEDITE